MSTFKTQHMLDLLVTGYASLCCLFPSRVDGRFGSYWSANWKLYTAVFYMMTYVMVFWLWQDGGPQIANIYRPTGLIRAPPHCFTLVVDLWTSQCIVDNLYWEITMHRDFYFGKWSITNNWERSYNDWVWCKNVLVVENVVCYAKLESMMEEGSEGKIDELDC